MGTQMGRFVRVELMHTIDMLVTFQRAGLSGGREYALLWLTLRSADDQLLALRLQQQF
jgi:hypothetical protein